VSALFYLVRHAEAERREGVADRDRKLTGHGRSSFTRLAASLPPSPRIRRILTSPFARARETALILSAASGAGVAEEELLASGRSTGAAVLELARGSGDGAALVGHNPEIAEAMVLASGSALSVPAGAIAAVEATVGGCRLLWVRSP